MHSPFVVGGGAAAVNATALSELRLTAARADAVRQ